MEEKEQQEIEEEEKRKCRRKDKYNGRERTRGNEE